MWRSLLAQGVKSNSYENRCDELETFLDKDLSPEYGSVVNPDAVQNLLLI
jgi:hypothetical protein